MNVAENAIKKAEQKLVFTAGGREDIIYMYNRVIELFDKCMVMFVSMDKNNIDEIIDLENEIDQLEIDLQNHHVKRLSKGECTVEIGLIFTDLVIGLERVADHATNIAYSIFHDNPEEV